MEDNDSIENPTPPFEVIEKDESEAMYTISELRTAQVFIFLITVGLFILIIGGVWSIGDIFSSDKWGQFTQLSFYSKIFIVGIILLGLFFICIFLVVFYRRGRNSLLKNLFSLKIKEKGMEEYFPARIISFGTLISIIAVIFGAGILAVQLIMDKTAQQHSNFWLFFTSDLTGGSRVLLIGAIEIGIVLFFLAFVFFWQNGYHFIVTRILKINEKIVSPVDYTPKQKTVGKVFFIILSVCFVVIAISIVWAIADMFQVTGKLEAFENAPLGEEFILVALIATGVFIMLILAMLLYKSGNLLILKAVYYRILLPTNAKGYTSSKIIAGGIMLSIFLCIIATVSWAVTQLLTQLGVSTTAPDAFLQDIINLTGGLRLMVIGLMFTLFFILILLFIYVGHNGYALLVQRIMISQDKLDKHLESESKIKIKVVEKPPKTPKPAKEPKPPKAPKIGKEPPP
jgi:hypothetical protein